LFALHPEHGTLRIEVCEVMITGNQAQAAEPTRVMFERGSAYRNKQGQQWGIPVWESPRRARAGELPALHADQQHAAVAGLHRAGHDRSDLRSLGRGAPTARKTSTETGIRTIIRKPADLTQLEPRTIR
jgi:hypothetical protein